MGACNSNDDRKKKQEKPEKQKDNTPIENIKIDINGENDNLIIINEEKKEEILENNKLKGMKNINFGQNEYSYKLVDTLTNELMEDKISSNCRIFELLNRYNLRTNGDFIIEFENSYKISYEQINDRFDDLMTKIFQNKVPDVINMKYTYKGLDIPDDVKKEYINSNEIIGSAILDNQEFFIIITYEREKDKITPYYYKRKENEELIKFNLFTAFCNAKGCLYFSGGENESSYDPDKTVAKYNDFFCVDLTKLNENNNKIEIKELQNLIEPRTWHSMIYIPNKYIFIVGGSNTKSVELYNIETNELVKDSELNENRSECTLCLVNNMYLYAFYGFLIHQEYNKTIERCNLLKEERKWEYVECKSSIDEANFKISFFGISYYNSNDLLLIGGNDNGDEKHYDYIYKIGENGEKDEINEINCNLNDSNNVFRDKLFLPIDDDNAVNIPLIIGEEIKILILNTNTRNIIIKNYDNSIP